MECCAGYAFCSLQQACLAIRFPGCSLLQPFVDKDEGFHFAPALILYQPLGYAVEFSCKMPFWIDMQERIFLLETPYEIIMERDLCNHRQLIYAAYAAFMELIEYHSKVDCP